ncbi:MAG: hypothetical protein FD175_543 [Beijerinckiaceae bacterium]|nr:MAG: hypothetical protein FD175_543 [Beijerinckiaceae bacterium]
MRGNDEGALRGRLLDLGVGEPHVPRRADFGLAHALALRLGRIAGGNRPIVLFGENPHFGTLNVTGDDQNCIVRAIEATIVGQRILAPQHLDLMAPPDHRRAVGMVDIERRQHAFLQLRGGITVGAHLALLDHDIALGENLRAVEHEAGHPVGFQRHHRAEVLFGDTLVIGGVIVGGEGVLLPAKAGDNLGKLALGVLVRALEHQMFEKMRDAGLALRIIRRAIAVIDHMRDDRRASIGDHHDLKPIGEVEMINRRAVAHGAILRKKPAPAGCGFQDKQGAR